MGNLIIFRLIYKFLIILKFILPTFSVDFSCLCCFQGNLQFYEFKKKYVIIELFPSGQRFGVCLGTTFRQNNRVVDYLNDIAQVPLNLYKLFCTADNL